MVILIWFLFSIDVPRFSLPDRSAHSSHSSLSADSTPPTVSTGAQRVEYARRSVGPGSYYYVGPRSVGPRPRATEARPAARRRLACTHHPMLVSCPTRASRLRCSCWSCQKPGGCHRLPCLGALSVQPVVREALRTHLDDDHEDMEADAGNVPLKVRALLLDVLLRLRIFRC